MGSNLMIPFVVVIVVTAFCTKFERKEVRDHIPTEVNDILILCMHSDTVHRPMKERSCHDGCNRSAHVIMSFLKCEHYL